MLALVRLALQVVLFFTLLSVVIAVASAATGLVEKVALAALVGMLICLPHWCVGLARRSIARST